MASAIRGYRPSEGFGQKVKKVVSAIGTAKAVFEAGRTIYAGAQAVAPYVAAGVAML